MVIPWIMADVTTGGGFMETWSSFNRANAFNQ